MYTGRWAIQLFDARKLRSLIGVAPKAAPVTDKTAVVCPNFGRDMVRRTARKGSNAGNQLGGVWLMRILKLFDE